MIAILLGAGFATRMYPLTKNFPKPLLKVGGKPVLDYLIDQLMVLPGLNSIYVVTNELFYKHFLDWLCTWNKKGKEQGIKLEILNDGSTNNENRLGAIKDLAFLLDSLKSKDSAIVAAGDNIYRFSLKPIAEEFIRTRKNFVIAIEEIFPNKQMRKGIIDIGLDGRVLKFFEDPQIVQSALSCPPIYFLQPSALDYIEEYLMRPHAGDAPGYFISYLVEREPVYAIKVNGKRLDIGTIESYEEAKRILSRERVIIS